LKIEGFDIRLNLGNGVLITVGVWCLMTVVLANAYAGTLLSFLSVTKLGPAINSLEELAKSTTCQLIGQGGTDLAINFLVHVIEIIFYFIILNVVYEYICRMQRMELTS